MSANERNQRFIEFLGSITQSPGPRADLRRCLNKPAAKAHQAHRYVAPFIGAQTYPAIEEAFYTVAALFATHANSETNNPAPDSGNLGEWLGRRVASPGGPSQSTVEARLFRVIRMNVSDLRPRLHDLVRSGQPNAGPVIPWAALLSDLSWWDHDEAIAKKWIQGFFRTSQLLQDPSSEINNQGTN